MVQAWRHLALWRGAQEPEWITLSTPTRPDLTLSSGVVEHLESSGRAATKLAPDRLLEHFPLKEKTPYREVWEAFLRNPGMPIVPERAVREAVKEGVKQGLVGLEVAGEIYYKRDVPDALLDEADVIPADLAASRVEVLPPSPAQPKEQASARVSAPETPAPQTRPKREYRLSAKIPAKRMSDFFRGVIIPLQDTADDVEVEIRVRARKEEGLPENVVEQKVRETLRQLAKEVEILEDRLE